MVSGAFMLVKRELWEKLDGFDRAFFMYGEDADFCLRAGALGYRPMVTARAVCYHEGGKSSPSAGKLILLFTGKATLIRRHFPSGLRGAGVGLLVAGVCCARPRAGSRYRCHRCASGGRRHRGRTGRRCGPPARNGGGDGLYGAADCVRSGRRCQLPIAVLGSPRD